MPRIAFAVSMIVVLLVIHGPTFPVGMFAVDDVRLVDVPQVQSLTFESLRTLLLPGNQVDYYPVRDFSYVLDWSWGKDLRFDASPARMQSLFWLLASGGLLYFLILRLYNEGWAQFLTAFWLISGFHFEMVWWISGRKDVLAIFWALLATTCLMIGREGKWRFIFLLAALISSALSMLSKSSFMLAPPAVLIALWLSKDRIVKSERLLFLTLGLMSFITIGLGLLQKQHYSDVNPMYFDYEVFYRILASAAALGRMILGVFYPGLNRIEAANWGEWLGLNQHFVPIGMLAWAFFLGTLLRSYSRRNPLEMTLLGLCLALYLTMPGPNPFHRGFYSTRYFEPIFIVMLASVPLLTGRVFQLRRWTALAVLALSLTLSLTETESWSSPLEVARASVRFNPANMDSLNLLLIESANLSQSGRLSKDEIQDARQAWTRLESECHPSTPREMRNSTLCLSFWKNYHSYKPFTASLQVKASFEPQAVANALSSALALGQVDRRPISLRFDSEASEYSSLNLLNSEPEARTPTVESRVRALFRLCYQGDLISFRETHRRQVTSFLVRKRDIAEAFHSVQAPEDRALLHSCIQKATH